MLLDWNLELDKNQTDDEQPIAWKIISHRKKNFSSTTQK